LPAEVILKCGHIAQTFHSGLTAWNCLSGQKAQNIKKSKQSKLLFPAYKRELVKTLDSTRLFWDTRIKGKNLEENKGHRGMGLSNPAVKVKEAYSGVNVANVIVEY
jgi:hypothetical protein